MNIQDMMQEVIPTKQEITEKNRTANKVLKLIKHKTKQIPQIIDVDLGGSYAKDTWLASSADIDIFVKFTKNTDKETFRRLSKQVGYDSLKKFNPYEKYAEHPYVIARVDNTIINIVPCYDITDGKWKSAADRSPYHTQYIQERLTASQKNEVRVLKQFLQNYKIYGAEIASQGFSGYVAEVLVLHFGGFLNTLSCMADIESGDVIGKTTKSFDTPITIIDPIDDNRNLAAAISKRNMALFILACRSFLINPSRYTFENKTVRYYKNWENVVCVEFSHTHEILDTLWGQTKKMLAALRRQLKLNDFNVIKHHIVVDNETVRIFLLFESLSLPKVYVREGPKIFRRNSATRFMQKNDNIIWVSEDMNLLRLETRLYTDAFDILNHLLSNPTTAGIPAGLHPDVKKYAITHGPHLDNLIKQQAAPLMSTDGATIRPN